MSKKPGNEKYGKNEEVKKEVSLQDLIGIVGRVQGSELKSTKSTVDGIEFETGEVKLDLTISFRED